MYNIGKHRSGKAQERRQESVTRVDPDARHSICWILATSPKPRLFLDAYEHGDKVEQELGVRWSLLWGRTYVFLQLVRERPTQPDATQMASNVPTNGLENAGILRPASQPPFPTPAQEKWAGLPHTLAPVSHVTHWGQPGAASEPPRRISGPPSFMIMYLRDTCTVAP